MSRPLFRWCWVPLWVPEEVDGLWKVNQSQLIQVFWNMCDFHLYSLQQLFVERVKCCCLKGVVCLFSQDQLREWPSESLIRTITYFIPEWITVIRWIIWKNVPFRDSHLFPYKTVFLNKLDVISKWFSGSLIDSHLFCVLFLNEWFNDSLMKTLSDTFPTDISI